MNLNCAPDSLFTPLTNCLTNYHSHSTFCDGKAPLEDFVVAAIEAGFCQWGASPHCPLPMLKQAPWAIASADVPKYIAEMDRLKGIYGDRIKLFTGMEIDYIDSDFNPASAYFQSLPLDFRIGSVHLIASQRTGELVDIDCAPEQFARAVDYHFAGSVERVVRCYYAAMMAMVELGGFDFIGHPDKVSMNARAMSGHICDSGWYKKLVDDFFVECAHRGVRLEINTKAYEIKGLFFPDERYFGRIKELKIATIINSDAHRVERIASGLMAAHQLLSL